MEQDRQPATRNRIDGPVTTALQIGTVHGGVYVNAGTPAPEPVADPPQGWDDLPELPPAIEALLRAQVRTAEDLPYRLHGARQPSLEAVYVRQEVSSGTETQPPEPTRPLPMLDSQGRQIDVPARPLTRVVVRPPSRTVQAALDEDDHLLVTGGPGQGKSTLSLRLAADIAARWSGGDSAPPLAEPVVPLRLPARELATRLDMAFVQGLAQCVLAEYGALLMFPFDAGTLAGRMAGCRWLLLVDGLDEVADLDLRDRLVKVLAARASDEASAHFRIVLTTRPIAGAALVPFHRAGAARYELLPFDEEALCRFAANWFVEDDAAGRFVRQVHDANLDELVRVPLLATIAAIMFEQDDDRPLPDNRFELYEAYLAYLHSARSIGPAPWDDHRESLFEHLGRVRLEEDTSLLAAACDWAAGHVAHACGSTNWRDELTTYLTTVGPFVSRGGDVGFLHHSFAEHLAATAHARLLPYRFDPEAGQFVRLLHSARPGERGRHARFVLLHYTRLHLGETDRLIGYLHAGTATMQVLGAQLLAWHAPASTDVTDAFLTTARAWAMSTQYPAQAILAQVSRAAHHPGLAEWLCHLMRDETAPWESRIEAGRALAVRLYGPDRQDGVTMLRSLVADEAISVEFRFEAAKALADCGASERAAAVAGLLSVLTDPTATAFQCRNAAIVLAGLGSKPRSKAVDTLLGLLDNPMSTQDDQVQAAMGLLEVSAGHEHRCTELFRAVLSRRNGSVAAMRNAALGLASLGAQNLAEAAAALKSRLADRRKSHLHVTVARVLAELGPEHRLEAGELLFAAASNRRTGAPSRMIIAISLAEFGPELRERTLALLHTISADRLANTNARLWMAHALVDLGPEHHSDAVRELNRLVRDPRASGYDRMTAWSKLADLGEPHRTAAVRALLRNLANRDADPEVRVHTGRELIRLGPEFHAEAARHVLEIASGRTADPELRVSAWQALKLLGPEFHDQASRALLDLAGPREARAWEAHASEGRFFDDTDPHATAAALTAVLQDSARGVRHRLAAARGLVNLGRHHHADGVAGLLELLERREIPAAKIASSVAAFSSVNAARRAELAEVLISAALTRQAPAELVCAVAEALAELDVSDPRLDEAMHALLSDESITGPQRAEAAMILARTQRLELPTAVAIVLPLWPVLAPDTWFGYREELATLGADVPEDAWPDLSAVEAKIWVQEKWDGLLFAARPERAEEALAKLRSQATDEHLQFTWRTDAVIRLAELDPATADEAIAFHRKVLDDEAEPVSHRCEAADRLVRLDVTQHSAAMAVLRRLAGRSDLRDTERERALNGLRWADLTSAELVPLARAIVYAPATSNTVRQRAARYLPAAEFRAVSRATLADYTASITNWTEVTAGYWDNWAVASEAEAALRDTLTGPETDRADRVAAAAALGKLSPCLVPQAVAVLAELGGSGRVRVQRLLALAELDRTWRARVLADARAALDGEDRTWRHRIEAAALLIRLAPEPLTEADRVRLAQLLSDSRLADQVRIELLAALGRFEDIRALRDDARARAATRWEAANRMCHYRREDRERGARVLAAIAEDPASRPALRWRAAEDLATFGAQGRALATERLQTMTTDGTLPVLVRIDAARTLGRIRPDLRDELVNLLHELHTIANVTARIRILEAIGRQEPYEAALALRAMAEDPALSPVTRLRCAESMSALHRGYREAAALVCRELAHDEGIPCYIRIRAARELALLSALCRQEARGLLTELRGRQPRSRASAAAQSPVPDGS
ncbi:hypothetical protein [Amycolatopsis sp. NPDC004169]|uniref:hypothetical protein n=1 Tax=Amycolatopsis sp. NPDC004169 TaxID=3154453 RepID=UPI0033AF4379